MYNPQLETFIHAADAGSFARAAAEMYISATAVTKQIDSLERKLGFRLFARSHGGLKLIDAGKQIYEDAKYVIQCSKTSVQMAREAASRSEAVLNVGVHFLTPRKEMIGFWQKVKEEAPWLGVNFIPFENRTATISRVLNNLGDQVDLIFWIYDDLYLSRWNCRACEISRQPVRIAVSEDSPLASREILRPEDLKGMTLVTVEQGWYRTLDETLLKFAETEPDIRVTEIPAYDMNIFNRCANDLGICFPAVDMMKGIHPGVRVLPVDWNAEFSFGALYAENPSRNVRLFVDAAGRLSR